MSQSPLRLPEVLSAVQAALATSRIDEAGEMAEGALAEGLEHPLFLNLAAFRLELQGKYGAAIETLHRALDLAPDDPFVLNSIGVSYSKSGLPTEALEAFDAALRVRPDLAAGHYGRGLALAALGDRAGAKAAYTRAAELAGGYADPLGGLAALAVDERRYGEARTYAEQALARDPRQTAAALALATVELREGKAEAAATRIEGVIQAGGLAPLHLGAALRQKADALDALGRYDEAIAAYHESARGLRELFWPAYEAARTEFGVEYCRRLLSYFEAAQAAAWRAEPGAAPVAKHIFLVGFPRSGTTLLEQVLASHPDVVALEEKPTLDPDAQAFFTENTGLDRLAGLGPEDLDRRRAAYWDRVAGFGADVAGKVFVDKGPLDTIYLPLIAKLFPDALIIVAIRDPRDVVLSCYRRPFRAGPIVFEFTDLMRTAFLYDAVMRLGVCYEPLLGLRTHLHRHERMIEAFDEEVGLLCDFLGLSFEAEAMRNFTETATLRDVRTPSAEQVRRPLNAEGVGHWKNYRQTLEPVLPLLEPWVKAFGYETSDTNVP
jgi:tetratricopeptide (TPR) repeat protein